MIARFYIILVFIVFTIIIFPNISPIKAQVFEYCSGYGSFGPCSCSTPGCNGLQYQNGTDNVTGAACTVSQSCNTTPNSDSCGCGAPNHNLVTCGSGQLCTGVLGDGCGYCVSAPASTSTPGPTSGPGPTSPPASTPTLPPGPTPSSGTGGSITCKFTNGWDINHTTQGTDTNGISYYRSGDAAPQLDVTMTEPGGAGCWDFANGAKTAKITQLGIDPSNPNTWRCGHDPDGGSPLSASNFFGMYAAQYVTTGPKCYSASDPTQQNCLSNDTDTVRDRLGSTYLSQNPDGSLNYGVPLPGTYCMQFEDQGHAGGTCNSGHVWADCEFTVLPSTPMTCSLTQKKSTDPGTGTTNPLTVNGGDSVTWYLTNSSPAASSYWNGTNNGSVISPLTWRNPYNGTSDNVTYLQTAPNSYTRYVTLKDSSGNIVCTTNTVNTTIVAPSTPTLTPTPVPLVNSCSISTQETLLANGSGTFIMNQLRVTYAGSPNTTNLWISKKDGSAFSGLYSSKISNPPAQSQPGGTAYKVDSCPAGTSCSVYVAPPTDLADYYIWCDNVNAVSTGCSGNPHCSYKNSASGEGGGVNCGSQLNSCSTADNVDPISGSILNIDGTPQANARVNNGACVPVPYKAPGTTGGTDSGGYFLIDNMPVHSLFCIRPDAKTALANNTNYTTSLQANGFFNPTSYEMQYNGGKSFDGGAQAFYDLTEDNAFTFRVPSPTATPTPVPPPLTLASCSLQGSANNNNKLYANTVVTWTADTPGGGSGSYNYQWFDDSAASNPSDPSMPPTNGPAASWSTKYTKVGPVSAHVVLTDKTYPGLSISRSCSANIVAPSFININGDTHSNQ